ncbi:MAG TPA: FtsQ-type POTRA domain-containing protein [Verrucomicrobiota bacterium]|nr:FtsQ-type POTRA domain-containing protein [Verrucomicrobiota bacterium]HRZ34942.1 FtsQ-type POTRA domain-containing protein [Candidatus Paceibacterota bacterium]HRZ56583.1 FtsQ-type POTRA domain-containing protein [Candidatus Paceibacterota bacterium]
MGLWGKPKNRRAGRGSVLEVKMRVRPVRQARRHRVVFALFVAMLAVVAAGLGQRGWQWARQRLMDSGLFALTSLEIATDGIWLKPEQIRQLAGIREGDNLLLIDMTQVRREIELIAQVESVSVERVLPHVLRIQVKERDPIVQIQAIQPEGEAGVVPAVFYLDRAGVVMPPLPTLPSSPAVVRAFDALPILRGLNNADLRPGAALQTRPVQSVLELLATFEPSPLAQEVGLAVIDISSPDVLRVTTDGGAEITLAYDRVACGLERWRLVRQAGQRLDKAVAFLDLAVTNNCPVLWFESSAVPPLKPRAEKLPRLRRKHV